MTRTHKQFLNELKTKNSSIRVIGRYTRAVDNIQVECLNCHYKWSPKAYSLLQGKGCPHCSALKGALNNKGKTKRKSHNEFIKRVQEMNSDIIVQSLYESNKSMIQFKCKRCGHVWKTKAYSILQGHGCPKCARSGTSFMEQFIYISFSKLLGDKSVLSRNRSIIGMELDIVIPEYNIAFEPGNWNLHKKNINRDLEKRIRCQKRGIRLITIYDKFNDEKIPFSNDCYVFKEDLNKTNHDTILQLVYDLFDEIGVKKIFTKREIHEIEELSYKNSKSFLNDDFIQRMKEIHPKIIVIGKYVNSSKKIQVKCAECNHVWYGTPANMLSGNGCPICGIKKAHKNFLRDEKDFKKELEMKNPNVEILGKYNGRHQTIRTKCKICGYEWNPIAGSLLRGSSHKGSKKMHKNKNDD